MLKRLVSPEGRKLQKELAELALQQDPQVVFQRSLDFARTLRVVGTEAAQKASSGGLSTESAPRRRKKRAAAG